MQCHSYIICANDIGLLITIRLISMLDLDLEEDNKSEAGTNYDRAYIMVASSNKSRKIMYESGARVASQHALFRSGLVLQTPSELYDGGARSSRNSGGAAELDDAWFPLCSCGG